MSDVPALERPPAVPSPRDVPHWVVLVEDDPGDTLLFQDAVGDADPELRTTACSDVDELERFLQRDEVSCIVLDLGLPGMVGFEALDRILDEAPAIAVVVLTGWGDVEAGITAVARGAQDYLVKGDASGPTLARSIRFAIERKRSQLAAAALAESELRREEQHRLERALVVDPVVRRGDLALSTRYISAREGVVSGDFYDGIELPDGTIRMIVGDVSGHGPDEAALGVSLRAGWRSLVLAGLDPDDVLAGLEALIEVERPRGDEFATVCDLTIAADLSTVCVRSAGHPSPVLVGQGALLDRSARAPIGVRLGPTEMPGTEFSLSGAWSLVAYTDGLFEVRDRAREILDASSVPAAVEAAVRDGSVDPDLLIADFAGRTDEGWRDDVAIVVIECCADSGSVR